MAAYNNTSSPPKAVTLPVTFHVAWSPLALAVLLSLPALLGSLLVPSSSYLQLWGQPDYYNAYKLAAITNMAVILTVFAVSLPLLRRTANIAVSASMQLRLRRATAVTAWMTFGAYAVWAAAGVLRGMRPSVLLDAITGEQGAIYLLKSEILAPISGVTTWSQLGIVLGPLLVIRWRLERRFPVVMMSLLLGALLMRAFFFSERLALIEVLVSTLIAWAVFRSRPLGAVKTFFRWFTAWAGALMLLVLLFAAFEYPRSWLTFYASSYNGTLLEFAATRLVGYYSTALNNGALMLETFNGRTDPMAMYQGSLPFLHPGASTAQPYGLFRNALHTSSNPEFNNVSGLLAVNASLGDTGALVFWLLFAVAVSAIAVKASSGSLAALIVYCTIAIGVLEMVRLFYFGATRFLPVVIALVLLVVYLRNDDGASPPPVRPQVSVARGRHRARANVLFWTAESGRRARQHRLNHVRVPTQGVSQRLK